MRPILNLLGAVWLCLAGLSAHAAHTQVRLILAAETARPGDTVLAGVQLRMDPRWHTYWRNPGAGIATKIEWQLPTGVTAGAIQWPVPEKLPDKDLTTYIYTNEVVLLVPLRLAADLRPGPLNLKASVSWLECDVQCVPWDASVKATLDVGAETKRSKDAPLIEAWQGKLPKSGDGLSARAWWEIATAGNSRLLVLEWASTAAASEVDFFPDASEDYEVQPATERVSADPSKIRLRMVVKKLAGDWPRHISGVLIRQSDSTRLANEVSLPIESPPAAATAASSGVPFQAGLVAPPLWKMLLYAFLGGLILNVMPCVLPVIALKILGFVSQAKDDLGEARKLGLIHTFGVLASFLLLALIVVGLRAAGHSVGWGFQFTNPYFLFLMTALVTLIALNLFGVFEVTASGGTLSAATALTSKHGARGAFFNGLLATVLATSCSAPILAGAVGFAFAQNSAIIILVMLAVGLGLAAPYLVLSWHPAWLRYLPKPGPWMERFKVAMGFLMLGAAVWLCSLLTIHYGERAWWMAVFLVFIAVATWVYGEFVQRGRRHRWLAGIIAAALLGVGYAYAAQGKLRWLEPARETAATQHPSESPSGITWREWSPEAVAAARAQGRPVLVDFTAKWCLTCNTIIKLTLENLAVQKKIKEVNAVPLLANYTLQPPSITAELKRFGRAAVPLVLVYPRNPSAPPMVFDLITPSTIMSALNQAAR